MRIDKGQECVFALPAYRIIDLSGLTSCDLSAYTDSAVTIYKTLDSGITINERGMFCTLDGDDTNSLDEGVLNIMMDYSGTYDESGETIEYSDSYKSTTTIYIKGSGETPLPQYTYYTKQETDNAISSAFTSGKTYVDEAISAATSGLTGDVREFLIERSVSGSSEEYTGYQEVYDYLSASGFTHCVIHYHNVGGGWYSDVDGVQAVSGDTPGFRLSTYKEGMERVYFITKTSMSLKEVNGLVTSNMMASAFTSAITYTDNAISAATSGATTKEYVDNAVSGKQDTLISGTNIKTINGQTILGSGNIEISGGSGSGSTSYYTPVTEKPASASTNGEMIYHTGTTGARTEAVEYESSGNTFFFDSAATSNSSVVFGNQVWSAMTANSYLSGDTYSAHTYIIRLSGYSTYEQTEEFLIGQWVNRNDETQSLELKYNPTDKTLHLYKIENGASTEIFSINATTAVPATGSTLINDVFGYTMRYYNSKTTGYINVCFMFIEDAFAEQMMFKYGDYMTAITPNLRAQATLYYYDADNNRCTATISCITYRKVTATISFDENGILSTENCDEIQTGCYQYNGTSITKPDTFGTLYIYTPDYAGAYIQGQLTQRVVFEDGALTPILYSKNGNNVYTLIEGVAAEGMFIWSGGSWVRTSDYDYAEQAYEVATGASKDALSAQTRADSAYRLGYSGNTKATSALTLIDNYAFNNLRSGSFNPGKNNRISTQTINEPMSTFCADFKFAFKTSDDVTTEQHLLMSSSDAYRFYMQDLRLEISNGKLWLFKGPETGYTINTSVDIAANTSYVFSITYDNEAEVIKYEYYLDGTYMASGATTDTPFPSNKDFKLVFGTYTRYDSDDDEWLADSHPFLGQIDYCSSKSDDEEDYMLPNGYKYYWIAKQIGDDIMIWDRENGVMIGMQAFNDDFIYPSIQ